jgi:hypothetical protein
MRNITKFHRNKLRYKLASLRNTIKVNHKDFTKDKTIKNNKNAKKNKLNVKFKRKILYSNSS